MHPYLASILADLPSPVEEDHTCFSHSAHIPSPRDCQLVYRFRDFYSYYFIPESIQLYDEYLITQVFIAFNFSNSSVKYVISTAYIKTVEKKIKMVSTKRYNDIWEEIGVPPDSEWMAIKPGTNPAKLLSKALDYCSNNDLKPKLWPVTDSLWYNLVEISDSGDACYYHPGTIECSEKCFTFRIRFESTALQNNIKYSLATMHLDSSKNLYKLTNFTDYDPVGKLININTENSSWQNIIPGSPVSAIAASALEYSHRNYIIQKITLDKAVSKRQYLATTPSGNIDYFNPDSIRSFDTHITVQTLTEYNVLWDGGVKYTTAIMQLKPTERKCRIILIKYYLETGKEKGSVVMPNMPWLPIPPGSDTDTLLKTVLSYC